MGEQTGFMQPRERWERLPLFLAIAFGWSWFHWLLSGLLPVNSTGRAVLRVLATFGPSAAALVVAGLALGRAGTLRWAAGCLRPRAGIRWYCLAFFAPLFLMWLAYWLHAVLHNLPGAIQVHGVWALSLNFLLIFLLGGPAGEELGWRGFMLPAMQARLNPHLASVLLGVIWALWHLPLFLLPGTVQSHLPFWLFLLNAVPFSVILGWVFHRDGHSIIGPLVLHTAVNGWTMVIPIVPDEKGYGAFAVGTAVMWVIGACVVAADRGGRG